MYVHFFWRRVYCNPSLVIKTPADETCKTKHERTYSLYLADNKPYLYTGPAECKLVLFMFVKVCMWPYKPEPPGTHPSVMNYWTPIHTKPFHLTLPLCHDISMIWFNKGRWISKKKTANCFCVLSYPLEGDRLLLHYYSTHKHLQLITDNDFSLLFTALGKSRP